MTLRDLDLELDYRSSHGRLVDRFYVPALRASREYARAAGYFTTRSISLIAAGLPEFIAAGGTLRLVCSPVLEPADLEALTKGYDARDDIFAKAMLRNFDDPTTEQIERERLGFVAWMVASGRLDIRIALRIEDGIGIYHEKFGVMQDGDGNAIAFTGSPNETAGGLAENFESIDVFRGWMDGEGDRVLRKIAAFDDLWADRTPGLATFDLPGAVRERLIDLRPPMIPRRDPLARPRGEPEGETSKPGIAERSGIWLRPYQTEAIDAWERADHRGILEMATGTGKTITSLAAHARTLGDTPGSLLLIAAPYIHLVDQWVGECERFGLRAIACHGALQSWLPQVTNDIDLLSLGVLQSVTLVVTHASLGNSRLHAQLARVDADNTMIIADEVHHLGAAGRFGSLDGIDAGLRLGLSATPRRWLDAEGDDRLGSYFGDVVFEFGLAAAIADGFLTPYDYDPILVELSADETALYRQITRQIAAAIGGGADVDSLGALLRRRAEVLNGAQAKMPALASLYPPGSGASNLLVYTTPSRLDAVVQLLASHSRLRVRRFTFREDAADRQSILRQFEAGVLDGLVAIRCLDEGVDVPGIREAVLTASSTNPREFIQRRGRILRRAPGKDSAVIHDLITVPNLDRSDDGSWTFERQIIKREMSRFVEFAENARNKTEARTTLLAIQDQYHLLDM